MIIKEASPDTIFILVVVFVALFAAAVLYGIYRLIRRCLKGPTYVWIR